MKRLFVLVLLVLLSVPVIAQDCDCYSSTRSQAIQLMQQQKYSKAISFFQAAKDCPDKPASNDLDAKIRECRNALKRIEEENRLAEQRRLEEENRRLLEQEEANWAPKAYMEVQGMSFGNKSDSLITPYGGTLYASEIKYLVGRIHYNGHCNYSRSLKIYVKIFKPDGTLMRSSSSPENSTYSWDITVYPGSDNTIYVGGWGSETGTTYSPGVYRWEIWYDGYRIYDDAVTILKKPSDATYLKVDGKTAVSSEFSHEGGYETFYVSTDASDWSTWGIPSWCDVVGKTSTSFSLRCQPNSSADSRSDYMKIIAGEKEVRIDISQSGDPSVKDAEIQEVTVDYDVYEDGLKGMMIHVKFDIDNCKSVPCRCVAYFYFSDGTALNDYNDSYSTSDDKVAVGKDFTPSYNNSSFNDFQMFIPYSELHLASGKHSCYFEVNIYEKSNSRFFDTEKKHSFTYTKE